MKLADYLKKHNLTLTKFGQQLGVTHVAVVRWINGERKPRPVYASKIVAITKGKVGFADLYGDSNA